MLCLKTLMSVNTLGHLGKFVHLSFGRPYGVNQAGGGQLGGWELNGDESWGIWRPIMLGGLCPGDANFGLGWSWEWGNKG